MNRRDFSKALAASAFLSGFPKNAAHSQETATVTGPKAFEIAIPQSQLADLKYRLQHTRWPDQPADAGWAIPSSKICKKMKPGTFSKTNSAKSEVCSSISMKCSTLCEAEPTRRSSTLPTPSKA